jgi:hypothetical protein
MKLNLIALFVVLGTLISSCGPSEKAVQMAISQTQTAMPTPTLEKIGLDKIDLKQLAIQEGDLPIGFTTSQIREHGYNPEIFEDEHLINMFNQEVAYDNKIGGRISIYLYDSSEEAMNKYENYISALTAVYPIRIGKLGNIGAGNSEAIKTRDGFIISQYSFVVFERCNAVFVAELQIESAYIGLIEYARRIDSRLKESVCQ